jgi:fucose permease
MTEAILRFLMGFIWIIALVLTGVMMAIVYPVIYLITGPKRVHYFTSNANR